MPRIFINYRRAETEHAAGRLYDLLERRFGEDAIFMDVDTIGPGLDFRKRIEVAIEETDVLIALIGDRWLTITNKHELRRLDDPMDSLRIEIEMALAKRVRIIPTLIPPAAMPHRDELPPLIEAFASLNAIELRHSLFRDDVSELIHALERLEPRKQLADEASRGQPMTRPLAGFRSARENLARAIHDDYRRGIASWNTPMMADWRELPEIYKESNRRLAERTFEAMHAIGVSVGVADGEVEPARFSVAEIEQMAEMEHDRWTAEKRAEGWSFGLREDLAGMTTPHLVSWAELSEEVKEYDRAPVRKTPELLASIGLQLWRDTEGHDTARQ